MLGVVVWNRKTGHWDARSHARTTEKNTAVSARVKVVRCNTRQHICPQIICSLLSVLVPPITTGGGQNDGACSREREAQRGPGSGRRSPDPSV